MHEQLEFDDGARRLLLFLDRPEVQEHIGTPEAYARYLGATAFGDWDSCCAVVNGLYMERPAQEAFVAQNVRPIVELDMPEQDWFQLEGATSANVMYLPPRPEVARRQLEAVYDTARNHEDPQASALLLRLGIYYAHRMFGGNTRGGAIHEALALRGYDGSADDRRFYATLATGRSGVRAAGMEIDIDVLPREFAAWYQGYVAQDYQYDGPFPSAIRPFALTELHRLRPEIDEWAANWACTLLAERHLGHVLAMELVLIGDDPNQFLIDRDDGGLDFDTEALFIRLDEDGCRELDALHEIAKVHFFSQLQDCFEDRPNAFGDWRNVAERIRVP